MGSDSDALSQDDFDRLNEEASRYADSMGGSDSGLFGEYSDDPAEETRRLMREYRKLDSARRRTEQISRDSNMYYAQAEAIRAAADERRGRYLSESISGLQSAGMGLFDNMLNNMMWFGLGMILGAAFTSIARRRR